MMKKIFLAVLLLLVIIAALPMVGNSYVQQQLQAALTTPDRYGLKLQENTRESGYVTTRNHYKFVVVDGKKFLRFIGADKQISAKTQHLLQGAIIGMDVTYNNLFFTRVLDVDIYPLALNPKLAENLKKKDALFAKKVEEFLQDKGILYHIEYHTLNKTFQGKVQDIAQHWKLKDATEVALVLQGASFKGKGRVVSDFIYTNKHLLINSKEVW
jgi:hypothetical protein